MKEVAFIVLVPLSLSSYAWECGEYDKHTQSVKDHYNLASDVIFGRVVSGSLIESNGTGYDISFSFDVLYATKTDRKGQITLKSSSGPPFEQYELGGYYMIFLFGGDIVSFCSLVRPIGSPISSHEKLVQHSTRRDIREPVLYKEVADLARKS